MVELLSAITVKVNWSRPYRRFEGVFPDQFLLQNRDAPLPRRERSVGRRPTAGAQYLDERGRLSSELVDAYAGGVMGLGPISCDTLRPPRLPVGRRPATAFSRESSQSLTPDDPAKRKIIQLAKAFMLLAT